MSTEDTFGSPLKFNETMKETFSNDNNGGTDSNIIHVEENELGHQISHHNKYVMQDDTKNQKGILIMVINPKITSSESNPLTITKK